MRRGRYDIQGLRAFAVLAVVLDHLFAWPRGGFVGVDVFFVISGFLITDLLLREHDRTGRISFLGFYRRRVKRILPAATVVLVATCVGAWLVFVESRFRETVVDAVWALLFSANWRFAAQSTDYFQQGRPPSPVQHYWSLSVEEQYYFVWPWLMLLIFAVLLRGRARSQARLVVFAAITAISAASFAWALHETATSADLAYFSTFSRVWELGLGAMLAVAVPVVSRLPLRLRPALAWVGLGGMVASLWLVSSSSAFPAPAAALPVLATALVIAAGTFEEPHRQQRRLWPLTNRVSGYVGDISYSLYLWHFPVIVLLAAMMDPGHVYEATCVVLILALSVASYHVVEQPLRSSPFLVRHESRQQRRDAYAAWRARFRGAGLVGACIALAAGVGLVARTTVLAPAPPPTAESTWYTDAGRPHRGHGQTAEERLAHDLEAALEVDTWPALVPPLGSIVKEGRAKEADSAGCRESVVSDPTSCSFGNPDDPSMYVIGDSTGNALITSVLAAYRDDHFVRGLTKQACQLTVPKDFGSDSQAEACATHTATMIAEVNRVHPDVLFVSDAYDVADNLASGARGAAASEEWRQGLQTVVDQVKDSVGLVVVVSPAVQGQSLEECATTMSSPSDCVGTIPEAYQWAQAAEEQVTGDNVRYLDTSWWFCAPDGRCPSFVGDTPLRRDDVHISQQWATKMAPFFKVAVDAWLPRSG